MVGHLGSAPSVSRFQAGGLLSSSCPQIGDPDGCCPRYLLLDRQASLLFLFRVSKLVGDGGNAPLVVFRPCLETAVLQTAGRNITRMNWWRQWELHPPQTACKAVSPLRHMCPQTGTACWCRPNHAEFWRLDCASWRTP